MTISATTVQEIFWHRELSQRMDPFPFCPQMLAASRLFDNLKTTQILLGHTSNVLIN